jgi:hypothetical protein
VFGLLEVEGEQLLIRIDERNKRIEHELTDDEKAEKRRGSYFYAPRWDYLASGELRLHMARAESTYVRKTWKDGRRLRLEDQAKTVLLALLDEAIEFKAARERQRLAEIERRRRERLEMEQSARREANTKLVHELEAQAGAWYRARFLRSYLRVLQRTLGSERLTAKRQTETIDFLDWARHYIDQLDFAQAFRPLTSLGLAQRGFRHLSPNTRGCGFIGWGRRCVPHSSEARHETAGTNVS